MNKAASLFLIAIMVLLAGCNRSVANNSATILSENNSSTEAVVDTTSDDDIDVTSEEKIYHCFYLKGDALYFADSKNNASPLKLTENLVTSGWYDVGTMNSLAGTLFCTYDEGTGLAFYSDYGNSNLYYKDTNNPNSGAVHIADRIASGYTRYIPEKSVVYYVSVNLELYEYDITSGTATMVDEQVTSVTKSADSDIVYRTDSGLYAKNAHEESYPIDSSSASDGSDASSAYQDNTNNKSGENEALWVIENYNAKTQTGDLTLNLNGESTVIDSDVIRIIT